MGLGYEMECRIIVFVWYKRFPKTLSKGLFVSAMNVSVSNDTKKSIVNYKI
jgi:hypothetical protein